MAVSRAVSRSNAARRAFTLVELLVVIGIIALLISILLPSLNKARQQANLVKCQANLKTIGQAVAIYVVNNKGSLPIGYANYSQTAGDYSKLTNWGLLLLNAIDSRVSTLSGEQGNVLSGNTSKTRQAFFCPEVPGAGVDASKMEVMHYTSNPRLIPDITQTESAPGLSNTIVTSAGRFRGGYKASKVKRSAEIAMFFDGSLIQDPANSEVWAPRYTVPVANGMDSYSMTYAAFFIFDPSNPIVAGSPYNTSGVPISLGPPSSGSDLASFNRDTPNNGNNIRFRHNREKVCPALFADGHAGQFNLKTSAVQGNISIYNASDAMRENFYVNRP